MKIQKLVTYCAVAILISVLMCILYQLSLQAALIKGLTDRLNTLDRSIGTSRTIGGAVRYDNVAYTTDAGPVLGADDKGAATQPSASDEAFAQDMLLLRKELPTAAAQLIDLRREWRVKRDTIWDAPNAGLIIDTNTGDHPSIDVLIQQQVQLFKAEITALEQYQRSVEDLLKDSAPKTYGSIQNKIDVHREFLQNELIKIKNK